MAKLLDINLKNSGLVKELEELEYLRFFYSCDLGCDDSDIRYEIREVFKQETGKEIPEGY